MHCTKHTRMRSTRKTPAGVRVLKSSKKSRTTCARPAQKFLNGQLLLPPCVKERGSSTYKQSHLESVRPSPSWGMSQQPQTPPHRRLGNRRVPAPLMPWPPKPTKTVCPVSRSHSISCINERQQRVLRMCPVHRMWRTSTASRHLWHTD